MVVKRLLAGFVTIMLLLVMLGYVTATEDVNITADIVKYNSKTGETVATGNVKITRGSLIATCLKAIANMNNSNVHLVGNVYAKDKTTEMWAKEAFYYGRKKVLKIFGSVKVVHKGYTLYADVVRYFMRSKGKRKYIATGSPAYILQEGAKLSGKQIEFENNVITVSGGVSYVGKKGNFTVTGDDAVATIGKGDKVEKVHINGNVHALKVSKDSRFEAWSDDLVYSANSRTILLTGNPKVKQGKRLLLADKIEYNLDTEEMKAFGKARIVLPSGK